MTIDYQGWVGHRAVDRDGETIGDIAEIYLDDSTGQPDWAAITTGIFGTKRSFVPLQGATASGDELVLAFSKAQVKDAPRIDPDGHLNEDEERRLYEHYSLGWGDYQYADVDSYSD